MPEKSVRSNQSGSGNKKSQKSGAKSSSRGRSEGDSDKQGAADTSALLGALDDNAARLALKKSDKLYYRIGEVSRLTGVKAHVLRYWETEFRWMAPPKSRSKQRLYRKRDIEFVWLLKRLLWDERYTIAGARQRIQELGVDGALALLDQTKDADANAKDTVVTAHAVAPTDAATAAPESGPSTAAWVSFRAALEDMQGELVDLKRALQDGS